MIEQLFFELLQVAIGTRQSLSKTPSTSEWMELFDMAKKQALTAIVFAGMNRLKDTNVEQDVVGASLGIDEISYLKWLGLTVKIAQRNKAVGMACEKLCKEYIHDGMRCCVLKGQSNLQYYPENLKECRTAGDIDLWALPQTGFELPVGDTDGKGAHYEQFKGICGTIEYVLSQWRLNGSEPSEIRYHHIDSPDMDGVSVETHFRPMYMSSPLRNKRLQRWFEVRGDQELKCCCAESYFPTPSVGFDAVYQLTHIYRHLFSEGIGMRQLLDYYFVLRALHIEQASLSDRTKSMAQWTEGMGWSVPSNEEVMHTLKRFGMKRFACAMMWVLREVFAMPSVYLICEPNEQAGRFLLDEIMMAGNFGKYDERNRQMQGASKLRRFFLMSQRNWRFFKQYPSEVFWDPFRRAYNVVWRKLKLWRY